MNLDDEGRKTGFWEEPDPHGGIISGDYVAGERNGLWRHHFRDGSVRAEMHYVNGQLIGECTWFRQGGGILGDPRPDGVPFETVLAAAQSGAGWATATLWREYAPSVAGFARGRGSRDPDDLASEVFLAVFDQLAKFKGSESDFRSFIFSIAYRRLVDELRQRSRRGEPVQWAPEHDPRSQPSAEDVATERLADSSVLSILDALPEDQRNVMVLRVVSDLTIEQIADILGKKPGAVKALQRRALESLRKKVSAKTYPFVSLERLPV